MSLFKITGEAVEGPTLQLPSLEEEEFMTSDANERPSPLCANAVATPDLLCSKCQEIRSWLQNLPRVALYVDLQSVFDHYKTGGLLRQSSLQGCHLCTLFWQSMIISPKSRFQHLYPPDSRFLTEEKLHSARPSVSFLNRSRGLNRTNSFDFRQRLKIGLYEDWIDDTPGEIKSEHLDEREL